MLSKSILQTAITQMSAQGKKCDYLKELMLNHWAQTGELKSKELDIFKFTETTPLRELYPNEVAEMQIFGRVLEPGEEQEMNLRHKAKYAK